eukprot:4976978-Prymnesium_polylepis.2
MLSTLTTKSLQECEDLKLEDTYEADFWNNKGLTWPQFSVIAGRKPGENVTHLAPYSKTWSHINTLEGASEEHVYYGVKQYLTEAIEEKYSSTGDANWNVTVLLSWMDR